MRLEKRVESRLSRGAMERYNMICAALDFALRRHSRVFGSP